MAEHQPLVEIFRRRSLACPSGGARKPPVEQVGRPAAGHRRRALDFLREQPPARAVGPPRCSTWPRRRRSAARATRTTLDVGRAGRHEGTSAATTAERLGRRAGGVATEQHAGGLGRGVGGVGAVHQRGQLVGERSLGRCDAPGASRARRAAASISSSGRRESIFRYVPTIWSSLCTQNWRNWYGEVRAGSSQTAPPDRLAELRSVALASSAGG